MTGRAIALRWPRPRRAGGTSGDDGNEPSGCTTSSDCAAATRRGRRSAPSLPSSAVKFQWCCIGECVESPGKFNVTQKLSPFSIAGHPWRAICFGLSGLEGNLERFTWAFSPGYHLAGLRPFRVGSTIRTHLIDLVVGRVAPRAPWYGLENSGVC